MTEGFMDDSQAVDGENRTTGEYKRVTIGLTDQKRPEIPLSNILTDNPWDIVFLEDIHGETPVPYILSTTDAQRLKDLGFTHYLIEASAGVQPLLDKLNQHQGATELRGIRELSPIGANPIYSSAIYHMADNKFIVRAISHPGGWDSSLRASPEEKENFVYQQIKDVRGQGGKPIILMGSSHAQPGLYRGIVPSATQRLLNTGENILSVSYRKQMQTPQMSPSSIK